jgi:hypothetical protein
MQKQGKNVAIAGGNCFDLIPPAAPGHSMTNKKELEISPCLFEGWICCYN